MKKIEIAKPRWIGKSMHVLAHTQHIDNNILFQHAEPVVTVCQSLNFICYCFCLESLNTLSFPFKAFMLGAFVYLSLPPPVSLKLPLLFFSHPRLHLFPITQSNHEAGITCLQHHWVPCWEKPTAVQSGDAEKACNMFSPCFSCC